jgi:hypothetical protein
MHASQKSSPVQKRSSYPLTLIIKSPHRCRPSSSFALTYVIIFPHQNHHFSSPKLAGSRASSRFQPIQIVFKGFKCLLQKNTQWRWCPEKGKPEQPLLDDFLWIRICQETAMASQNVCDTRAIGEVFCESRRYISI